VLPVPYAAKIKEKIMDDTTRMRELKEQGFFCSQILLILGMGLQGKDNPDLVRAMHALAVR